MTVEIGTGCRRFLLKNAMARLDKEKLSILAETITSPPKSLREPTNAMPPEEQDFDKECLVCGKGVEHPLAGSLSSSPVASSAGMACQLQWSRNSLRLTASGGRKAKQPLCKEVVAIG